MTNFLEENPWTCMGGLFGIIIGMMLPSGLDILADYDYSQISKDPSEFLIGYMVGMPIVIIVEFISGLLGGLIGATIGIFIDGRGNHGIYL